MKNDPLKWELTLHYVKQCSKFIESITEKLPTPIRKRVSTLTVTGLEMILALRE